MKYKIYIGFFLFLLISTPAYSQDSSDEEGGMFAYQKPQGNGEETSWDSSEDEGSTMLTEELDLSARDIEQSLLGLSPYKEEDLDAPMTPAQLLAATSPLKNKPLGTPVTPKRLKALTRQTVVHKVKKGSPTKRNARRLCRAAATGLGFKVSQGPDGNGSFRGLSVRRRRTLSILLKGDTTANKVLGQLSSPDSPHLPAACPDWEHVQGDENGGGHWLSQAEFQNKVVVPTQRILGQPPIVNNDGVWVGLFDNPHLPTPPELKTGFPVEMREETLDALYAKPTKVLAACGNRQLERWEYQQGGKDVELHVVRIKDPEGGLVGKTVYPLLHFQRLYPSTQALIPQIGNFDYQLFLRCLNAEKDKYYNAVDYLAFIFKCLKYLLINKVWR